MLAPGLSEARPRLAGPRGLPWEATRPPGVLLTLTNRGRVTMRERYCLSRVWIVHPYLELIYSLVDKPRFHTRLRNLMCLNIIVDLMIIKVGLYLFCM